VAYKSILVHVEPRQGAEARVALALDLARRFEARLIGVGAETFYPGFSDEPFIDAVTVRLLADLARKDVADAEDYFSALTQGAAVNVLWRARLGPPAEVVADEANSADLIVASRGSGADKPAADPGYLIMASGLPVLVAPPAASSLPLGRIVIGWKNTLQARSAIGAALPMLKLADKVEVVRVKAEDHVQAMQEIEEVIERLRCHGIKARGSAHGRSDASAANDLLGYARDQHANLIVVGAYAHARIGEWVFGGVTHDLLRDADIPVLFAR
jgi:nucleotide-binding universal stress UspA family protein